MTYTGSTGEFLVPLLHSSVQRHGLGELWRSTLPWGTKAISSFLPPT